MKLKTSFFNPTILKKDITRYSTVWGLYTIFSCLFVLLMWESEGTAARFVSNAPYIMQAMGVLNLLYAPLVVLLLFGDLFTSRMCNALHALPLRREGWFLTHLTAGLLFGIVPNLVSCLLAASLLGSYCYGAFLWLAVTVLQYLFFFGVGCFAAQCAGNRIGAIAVYSIINFLSVIAAWLALTFYSPCLYGVSLNFESFADCSPVVSFSGAEYIDIYYDNMTFSAVFEGFIGADWRYLFIAAAVGVALLGVSVLLYRKRQLESAGDMISFAPVAPVFLVIYTLCAGAVLYFIADQLAPLLSYIFLFIGLGIGFFTGKMLLERKTRVFNGKNFAFFGILLAVFAASIGITALDPFGITRYVPETEQVTQVRICMSHSEYDMRYSALALTDPEDIEKIIGVHEMCLENRYQYHDLDYRTEPIAICYDMKDGRTVERLYYVNPDGEEGAALIPYFSSVAAVFGTDDLTALLDSAYGVEAYHYDMDIPVIAISTDITWYKEEYGDDPRCNIYVLEGKASEDPILTGLMEAMKADCEAGTMAQYWAFHRDKNCVASVSIQGPQPDAAMSSYKNYITIYTGISIYEDCVNTIAYLEKISQS